MTSVIENRLEISSSINLPIPYADYVLGVAIFDLNGLPKEYYTTSESSNMSWVQTIFQALGLQSLLMSSLQVEGFHHATIYGSDCCAVVVKQRTHYTAMLVQKHDELIDDAFIHWMQHFQLSELRQNPRFHVA
ncbi:hypothetical protein [Leptothermofonsia sp. ETS-13]|uniref:hypothetical protein n=1 Tax=Leptothermofonsia sp. ETS-13 TaxID=3035696 RepID=UPI003BA3307B